MSPYIIILFIILLLVIITVKYLFFTPKIQDIEDGKTIFDDTVVYYINLDRSPRRKNHIENQLKNNDLVSQRISAVDARLIDIDDPKYKKYFKYHPNLWHVSAYDYYKQDPLHKGHFGAFLSHMKTYKTFLKSKSKYALIFEDDMEMEDLKPIVNAHYEYIPKDWDMIVLSYNISKEQGDDKNSTFKLENNILKIGGNFTSMGAYIINRNSAKTLLRELEDHSWLIDWKIGDLAQENKFNVYGIYPPFVCQPAHKFIKIKHLDIDYDGKCSTEMGGMFVTHSE